MLDWIEVDSQLHDCSQSSNSGVGIVTTPTALRKLITAGEAGTFTFTRAIRLTTRPHYPTEGVVSHICVLGHSEGNPGSSGYGAEWGTGGDENWGGLCQTPELNRPICVRTLYKGNRWGRIRTMDWWLGMISAEATLTGAE